MRGLTRRLRLVVMIAGTALVMTNLPHPLPLWAAGDQTKPSVKELIKGAKERRAVETFHERAGLCYGVGISGSPQPASRS